MDDSRLVRSRALEILSTLLESTSHPLNILGKDLASSDGMVLDTSEDQAKVECKVFIFASDILLGSWATFGTNVVSCLGVHIPHDFVSFILGFKFLLDHNVHSLLLLTDSLKALHVATGILDAMIKPLHQCNEMHGTGTIFKDIILSTVLWIIQALQETSKAHQGTADVICTGAIVVQDTGKLAQLLNQSGFQDIVKAQSRAKPSRGPAAARGGTLPKTVVLSALKALQSLATHFPGAVERSSSINIVLSVLFDQKLCSDQRVFKACLTTLPSVLKTKVQNGQLLDEQVFGEAMTVVLGLLQRPATGSTSLKLILTAVVEFFTDDTLGKVLAHEVS